MITCFSLFEICDLITYGGKKVRFNDKTVLPFFYYKNDLYVGKRGTGHGDMARIITRKMDVFFDEVFDNIYYQGRLFIRQRIISFWTIPNKTIFVEIINDLERKLNIKIWNNDYKLEIIRSDNISKEEYDRYIDFGEDDDSFLDGFNVKFIPIELYKKGYNTNKKSLAYRQAVSGGD